VLAITTIAGCDNGPIAPTVVTLATGLNNPTGLIVRDDGSLLVVESGAARIISVSDAGDIADFITGFSLATFLPYDIGPLSILAQSDGSLIVGEGGGGVGRELVSFFDATGAPSAASGLSPPGGGNFQSLALEPSTGDLFIASANTDRIFKATAVDGVFGNPQPFIADTTVEPIAMSAPTALAFDTNGNLLVGFADFSGAGIVRIDTQQQTDAPSVSRLYSTDRMVTAIAVRPSDGAIFFAEFSFSNVGDSRIASLDSAGQDATFTQNVVAPSAIAFDSNDTLYVTTLGRTPNATTGAILKMFIETFGTPANGNTNSSPGMSPPTNAQTPPAPG